MPYCLDVMDRRCPETARPNSWSRGSGVLADAAHIFASSASVDGGFGGGIYKLRMVTVSDTTISSNTAGGG